MVFKRLAYVLDIAQKEQELPDYISERVKLILGNSCSFKDRTAEIEALADMIELYDTYAQTGYLGMGVNSAVIEKVLKRLME
jgi:hypothetical protein